MTSIKELLVRCAEELEESIENEGKLASFKQAAAMARSALAQLDSADARSGNLRRVVLDLLNGVTPAVENLACHQEQADADGCMVKVSRQALDEVLSAVNEVAVQAATSLSTGLLPNASPGNGAVTSSVVAKIEEARDLFWDIKGDFSDPRTECRRGADLLEEVLTALHSTSAAGETTSSDGGVEGHAEGPQGHSCSREPEAGNTASSGQMTPAGIKPGPSEAIPAASGGKHNGHHLR